MPSTSSLYKDRSESRTLDPPSPPGTHLTDTSVWIGIGVGSPSELENMEEGKAGGGAEKMKRSASELALEEWVRMVMIAPPPQHHHQGHHPPQDYCYDSPHTTSSSITDAPLSLDNGVSLGLLSRPTSRLRHLIMSICIRIAGDQWSWQ